MNDHEPLQRDFRPLARAAPAHIVPGRHHVLCRGERGLPGLGGTQGCSPLPTPPGPYGSRLGGLAAAYRRCGQTDVQTVDCSRRRGQNPVPRRTPADDVARPDEPRGHPLGPESRRPEHQCRPADDLCLRVRQRHGHYARKSVFAEQIRNHLRCPRGLPERRLRNPHAAGGHHHDHGDGHDEPERDRRAAGRWVLALELLPSMGQPPGAGDLPHFLHLHVGGNQPRPLRHGRGRERIGRRRLHRILRDGFRRILHGRVFQYPARLRPGHGFVPGRLAEPLWYAVRGVLVPREDVLPNLFRGLDTLDLSADPVLRAAQPLLEDSHPRLPVHSHSLQRHAEAASRMKNSLKEIAPGFNSLLTGMRITLGQFFKPSVTVQYPHESLKMPELFRGHIELVRDPETGKAKCFACKLCERACPSDCIKVEGAKLEGAKKKSVTNYILDFTKCSLCGSCVEACRAGDTRFSRQYNLASTNKEDYIMDLFQRLENERLEAERLQGSLKSEVQSPKSEVPTPKQETKAADQPSTSNSQPPITPK